MAETTSVVMCRRCGQISLTSHIALVATSGIIDREHCNSFIVLLLYFQSQWSVEMMPKLNKLNHHCQMQHCNYSPIKSCLPALTYSRYMYIEPVNNRKQRKLNILPPLRRKEIRKKRKKNKTKHVTRYYTRVEERPVNDL